MLISFLQTGTPAVEKTTMLGAVLDGGWVMLPILVLLILSLYIAIFKFFTIRRLGTVNEKLLDEVIDSLRKGDKAGAERLVRTDHTLMARILERGLIRLGSSVQEIESGMESAARSALQRLEKGMGVLASVATLAPMFGFLGTVIGMILIFKGIASSGLEVSSITAGMYVKMISSAAGLVVGIMAHAFNTYLNNMLDGIMTQLAEAGNRFTDALYNNA